VSDGEDAENGQAVSSGSVGEEEEEEVVVATVDGKISRCRVSEVRITKRTARGVKLVRLEGEDRVRAVTLLPRSQDTSSEDPGDRYGR
jgi:DNA gyrase/topoisomerase IV subunit A